MGFLEVTEYNRGAFELPDCGCRLTDACLDAVATTWDIQLGKEQRNEVKAQVYQTFAPRVLWSEHRASLQDEGERAKFRELQKGMRAYRKKVGRKAKELLDAIGEGFKGLHGGFAYEHLYEVVPQIERLLPAPPPPKRSGRPRTTADLEDLTLALARIYIGAGGAMPARSFGKVFWEGVAVIKRDLHKGGVCVPSVKAMEGTAKKVGWRAKLKTPKP